MDEGEKSKGSWWQTVPGILTAIAGIITAVAGLLVTLHQIGLLSNKEKPAIQSPSSYNDTAKRSEATAPTATPAKEAEPSKAGQPSDGTKPLVNDRARPYSVTFPSGTEVTLRSRRADGTYRVLAAQVDSRNTGKLTLKLSIRLTNTGRSDLGFGSDSFRLVIDGVPRAPINFLNQLVEARSAKEGDVVFEVPDTAESLVLSVKNEGEDTADIPILLKKSR
jgi:hypothetical protein